MKLTLKILIMHRDNLLNKFGKVDYFKIDKKTDGLWLIVNEGVEEYRLFDKECIRNFK